jgi:uncharacterized membrane protein YeaQ/YmgE (transglycosylase-associated protein family)
MVTFLIAVLVGGLVIGALGRLLVPGPNPIGFGWTLLCGIAGSFLGGLLGRYLFHFGFVTLALEVLVAAAFVSLVARRQRGHAARRT